MGFTFNYGPNTWLVVNLRKYRLCSIDILFGAIFWTLGYDTIYGFQDIEDDEIIGVKSTSIKFKKNPKKFLSLCYFLFLISLHWNGIFMDFK